VGSASTSAPTTAQTVSALRKGFRTPPPDSAPMVRWWWFGPRVERSELRRELEQMRAAGFGGAEVAFVYPLSAETDRFLSPTFLADLRFAFETAAELGLRCDLTLGSGWSFGGPHIDADTAARRMHWERQEISPQPSVIPSPRTWPGDRLIAAYIGDGSMQEPPTEYRRLVVDGAGIHIPAAAGPRVVLTVTSRLTGQNVKRAAAGAEGPVLDHYSAEAIGRHIEAVCEPLLDAVPASLIGSVFCDSLEAYRADWTPRLPAEFAARRGYDPIDDLWLLVVDAEGSSQLRADVAQTLSELYEDDFLRPLHDWAMRRGVPLRVQSYGEPPATMSSYRLVDLFEGEGYGWRELPQTRWASSAARVYGRSVVSSEVWTWNHSPSFRSTPLDLTGEIHDHLLSGINSFVGHGWPYSPEDAEGVGWIFYAAGAFDARNPWWSAAPALTAYIHRLSWLMRQGDRVARVGVYVPARDIAAANSFGQDDALHLWRNARVHIGPALPGAIRDAGADFDLFDDTAVETLSADAFDALVLPRVTDLPGGTRAWIEAARERGARVLAVKHAPVSDALVRDEDLGGTLPDLIQPVGGLRIADGGEDASRIGVTRRVIDGVEICFVANTGPIGHRLSLDLAEGTTWERWDPGSGAAVDSYHGGVTVELTLGAYEATVLVGYPDASGVPSAAGAVPAANDSAPRAIPLDGDWTVCFPGDEDAVPVTLPHRWEDAEERRHYSGAATYRTTVEFDDVPEAVRLDFGDATPTSAGVADEVGIRGRSFRAEVRTPVGDVASVRINGRDAGHVWHPPYRLSIAEFLTPGSNSIEITVSNTLANALAADPGIRAAAELSARVYGRRFRMQDLDLALDGVSSGLHAVPTLRVQ
jgi:alpha-L-rhamnosidase